MIDVPSRQRPSTGKRVDVGGETCNGKGDGGVDKLCDRG